ncbi:MAG: RdgB/HAM1 family non-canonical purine NTP pyrophosphatase [Nitriliruptoraceae bacterium]|nr:RdgB/HAM1 family non-canonical purine NTP pyrophosphatase [Nitriliruptoraceae bacterium]
MSTPRPTGATGQRELVVASANAHKLEEIAAILTEVGLAGIRLRSMREFDVASPAEDGETFEANALIKARACVEATGLPAIADDSGIEVDALGGAPGVRSARFAGTHGDDEANNDALLAALADVADERRTARFVCAAALVTPHGLEQTVRGTMEGRVLRERRGTNGFGYDPLFVADATDDGRSNGELSAAEKDRISHRGVAFRALARPLQQLLAGR